MRSLRERVLVLIVDEGVVEDPAGRVTSWIGVRVDATPSRVGTVLGQLDHAGLVVRDHRPLQGRTFSVRPTPEGRALVGRDGHAGGVLPRRREAPVVRVAMPVPGPISRVAFDPDRAREAAFGGVA